MHSIRWFQQIINVNKMKYSYEYFKMVCCLGLTFWHVSSKYRTYSASSASLCATLDKDLEALLWCVCVNIDFSALWEGLGLICCWGTSHEVCKGPEDLPSSARHRCLSPPTHTTNTHAHTDELLKNLSSLGRETYMPEAQILKLLHSHISYSTQSNHIQYSYKTFKVYNNIKNANCYHKRYKVKWERMQISSRC